MLGRDLRIEQQPLEQARAEYAAAMGPEFADTALTHWRTLVDHPEQVRDGVEQVLGQPPRTFAEWARDHAHDFTLDDQAP